MAKYVFITGCSSGIGMALCKQFLERGFTVLASARNIKDLDELQHENLHKYCLDVNDDEQTKQRISEIEKDFGRLDFLINNAGFAKMGPIIELSREDYEKQFATNVISPAILTKALVPLLVKAKRPRVVNIGSVSGLLTTPFSGAYCASKAAIHSINDALRMELAPLGIRVICVQPGGIESNFGKNSTNNIGDWIENSEFYSSLKEKIIERAQASQDKPTSNKEFAEKLVVALMSDPASTIRLGKGSMILPFLAKWLPSDLTDRILSKRFDLSRLNKPE